MCRKFYSLVSCCLLNVVALTQSEIGGEYQHAFGKSYNSNSIGGVYEKFGSGNGSWHVVLHYTWDVFYTQKKTQGVGDFGLSLGYRHILAYGESGDWLGGVRATFSHLFEKDHTKFTPSVEFGYHFLFNNFSEGAYLTPSVAFGYDIPVGMEKAGDFAGPLFIPRLGAGYRY